MKFITIVALMTLCACVQTDDSLNNNNDDAVTATSVDDAGSSNAVTPSSTVSFGARSNVHASANLVDWDFVSQMLSPHCLDKEALQATDSGSTDTHSSYKFLDWIDPCRYHILLGQVFIDLALHSSVSKFQPSIRADNDILFWFPEGTHNYVGELDQLRDFLQFHVNKLTGNRLKAEIWPSTTPPDVVDKMLMAITFVADPGYPGPRTSRAYGLHGVVKNGVLFNGNIQFPAEFGNWWTSGTFTHELGHILAVTPHNAYANAVVGLTFPIGSIDGKHTPTQQYAYDSWSLLYALPPGITVTELQDRGLLTDEMINPRPIVFFGAKLRATREQVRIRPDQFFQTRDGNIASNHAAHLDIVQIVGNFLHLPFLANKPKQGGWPIVTFNGWPARVVNLDQSVGRDNGLLVVEVPTNATSGPLIVTSLLGKQSIAVPFTITDDGNDATTPTTEGENGDDFAVVGDANFVVESGFQEIECRWDTVADAESYNLYWSRTPNRSITTANRVENVSSPHIMFDAPRKVTVYLYLTAVIDGIERIVSPQRPTTLFAATVINDSTSAGWISTIRISSDDYPIIGHWLSKTTAVQYSIKDPNAQWRFHEFTFATSIDDNYSGSRSYLPLPMIIDDTDKPQFYRRATSDGDGTINGLALAKNGTTTAKAAIVGQTIEYRVLQPGLDFTLPINLEGRNGAKNGLDLVLDSSANAHMLFYCPGGCAGGALNYVTNTSGSWVATTVETTIGIGAAPRILVSADDSLHAVFFDLNDDKVIYAALTSNDSWTFLTVDDSAAMERDGNAIMGQIGFTADAYNGLHISYPGPNRTLKYSRIVGGQISYQTILQDDTDARFSAIAVDSKGRKHVSFSDNRCFDAYCTNALKYVDFR